MFDVEDSDGRGGPWMKRDSVPTLQEAEAQVEFLRKMHSRAFRITENGKVIRKWPSSDSGST